MVSTWCLFHSVQIQSVEVRDLERSLWIFFSVDRYQSLPAWGSTRKSMSRKGTYVYKFCVYDFVTSLSNTLAEIWHSHVLDRICFKSITNMGVESYFKRMRADHGMPTVANYPNRRVRCVEGDMLRISHISLCAIHFIRRKLSKVNRQTSSRDQTSSQQSLKEQVAKTKTKGEKLWCENLLGSIEEA